MQYLLNAITIISPYHEGLFERSLRVRHQLPGRPLGVLLQPVVGHHRALFGKTLHVLGFFRQKAQGNEEREVGVRGARAFDGGVERCSNFVPDAHAPGAYHHAAPHGRLVHELRCVHHVLMG